MSEEPAPRPTDAVDAGDEPERLDPLVTRRQFLVGAGAGAAVAAAAAGGAVVLSRPSAKQAAREGGAIAERPGETAPAGAPATSGAPAQGIALPASQRRVSLNIDGTQHDVIVDVRESLWETMTYTLGLAAANLAVVKLPADGRVCFASFAPTDLVVDLAGWFVG